MNFLIISLLVLMLAAANEPPAKKPATAEPKSNVKSPAKPAAKSAPQNKPQVEMQKGLLSVKSTDVPLKDLLKEMEAKSGVKVELKDEKAGERQTTFDIPKRIPLRVYQEVLKDLNYAFFFADGRLSRVVILPPGVENPNKFGGMGGRKFDFGAMRKSREQFGFKAKQFAKRAPRDAKVESKLAAIEALEDSEDPKSVAELGNYLNDPNPDVRQAALDALQMKEGNNVAPAIRRGLTVSDPEFRIEVLEALADLKDLDSLRRATSDSNQEVRERAAELLEDAKQ